MYRRFLTSVFCLSVMVIPALGADQPNVLIIMADDCTFRDLPMYGGVNAKTPNLDQLASQGMKFDHAYLCEAMCQPCRAELYTGQFPLRNGCAWNHSASLPGTKSIPHLLGNVGYRVGIAGKVHVKPEAVFPFEKVSGFEPNCVRDPTREHQLDGVKAFMSGRESPFCLVIALVDPHVPWVMGDPSQYPPRSIKLPPNIADTPRTRADFGRYLAEITYMDGQVGDILEALHTSGNADNTLVLFTSEQGSQFPGCKWTNWDTGVHTGLIARWPGKIAAGVRTDALVTYADILPTLLAAADAPSPTPPHTLDGMSFLPVLLGQQTTHRTEVYGLHNNMPEGPAYPIRTVSNGRFRYIRNLLPDEIYIEKHLMGSTGNGKLNNPYWATWVWDAANSPRTYNLVKRYTHRPAEQLYDTANDPYEMTNLVSSTEHAQVLSQLRNKLDTWMKQQGDPGAAMDTADALQAARRGEHLFVAP